MKAERNQRVRAVLRSVRAHALAAAAACFFATATTGCVSHHGDNAVLESHFTRLEQTCFGYEPTVWRTMTGQCESAVRQIPEPVIQVPKAAEPTPAAETPEPALNEVPEPGQDLGRGGLFGNFLDPPTTPNGDGTPPAEPAPGTAPMNDPASDTTPEPGTDPGSGNLPDEPAPAEPAAEPEPAPVPESAPVPVPGEPSTAPSAEPPTPQFSFSSARTFKLTPADATSQPEPTAADVDASAGAAKELFRTLESAMTEEAPQPARAVKAAPKKGPSGLAKFISY